MTTKTTAHPLDRLADWLAPAIFGASGAWSAWIAGGPVYAAAVGLMSFGLAIIAMRWLGAARSADSWNFEPVEFDEAQQDDELLLDDPLIETNGDNRVVRLFAGDGATPGELVTRIADYLGRDPAPPTLVEEQGSAEASAALHAALANIRASLR